MENQQTKINGNELQNQIASNSLMLKFWLSFVGVAMLILAKIGQGTILTNENYVIVHSLELSKEYFILVSIYIFCVSLYFGITKLNDKKFDIAFILFVIAILFNPFEPFSFVTFIPKPHVIETVIIHGYTYRDIIYLLTAGFFGYWSLKEFMKLK